MAQAQVTLKVSPAELRLICLGLRMVKEVCRVAVTDGTATVDVRANPVGPVYIQNIHETHNASAHLIETIG